MTSIDQEVSECAPRSALSPEQRLGAAQRAYDRCREALEAEYSRVRAMRDVLEAYRVELQEDIASTPAGCDSRPGMVRRLAEIDAALNA